MKKRNLMKKILSISFATALLLSGCASSNQPTYEASSYNQIKKVKYGVILSLRGVTIKDSGNGKLLGAVIGGILGSLVGRGSGSVLATLGGGLVGAYSGDKINEANAEELTLQLDNGEHIVVVAKGISYQVGQRVEVITDGNRVASIKRVE